MVYIGILETFYRIYIRFIWDLWIYMDLYRILYRIFMIYLGIN